jgi:hypothetical protein
MPMIDHEFLFSCFHPLSEEHALCLERNIFPQELQVCDLNEILLNEAGERTRANNRKKGTRMGDDDIVEEED